MPIQCEYFAMEGLTQMIHVIRRVMQTRPDQLEFGGIVLTMYDPRLELTHEVEQEVREFFGDIVFDTVIPRDVAVSQYFQWKHRMRVDKKGLLGYPDHGEDVSLFDFMIRPEWGVARVVEFMNFWARDFERLEPFTMTRYEDLRRDPETELGRVMAFLGTPASAAEIREAVERVRRAVGSRSPPPAHCPFRPVRHRSVSRPCRNRTMAR